MRCYELTNDEWEGIKDYLPPERSGRRERPGLDDRRMLNGMLWIVRSGAQWRELPPHYGKWSGVYTWFRKWRDDGVLETVFRALNADMDRENRSIDATVVKVHQSAKSGSTRQSAVKPIVNPVIAITAPIITHLTSIPVPAIITTQYVQLPPCSEEKRGSYPYFSRVTDSYEEAPASMAAFVDGQRDMLVAQLNGLQSIISDPAGAYLSSTVREYGVGVIFVVPYDIVLRTPVDIVTEMASAVTKWGEQMPVHWAAAIPDGCCCPP